jgi:hypothetical protein
MADRPATGETTKPYKTDKGPLAKTDSLAVDIQIAKNHSQKPGYEPSRLLHPTWALAPAKPSQDPPLIHHHRRGNSRELGDRLWHRHPRIDQIAGLKF